MKYIKLLLTIFLSFFFVSCSTKAVSLTFPEDKNQQIESLGNPSEAIELLEFVYTIDNIENLRFYYSNNTYHYVIYFSDSVTKQDLTSFKSYFKKIFLEYDMPTEYNFPFRELLMNGNESIFNNSETVYENFSLRVYKNNNKLYRSDYTFKDLILTSEKHWENLDLVNSFNYRNNEITNQFIKTNKTENINIFIEDSLTNYDTFIIKIKSEKEIDEDYITFIKSQIKQNLQPKLRQKALLSNEFSSLYKKCIISIIKDEKCVFSEILNTSGEWNFKSYNK